MHRHHHPSSKCTGILPLTHECTAIIIPQVNTPVSYPSHMNAPRSSSLMWMHRYPYPYTWMHRRHYPSSKCTRILPLTHDCTDIVTLQESATIAYPSHMNAPKSFIPQVNAPISYPSHINAPKIVTSQVNAQTSYVSICYPSYMKTPQSSSLK